MPKRGVTWLGVGLGLGSGLGLRLVDAEARRHLHAHVEQRDVAGADGQAEVEAEGDGHHHHHVEVEQRPLAEGVDGHQQPLAAARRHARGGGPPAHEHEQQLGVGPHAREQHYHEREGVEPRGPGVAHGAGQREVEDAWQRYGLACHGHVDVDRGPDAERRYGGDEEEGEVGGDEERHEQRVGASPVHWLLRERRCEAAARAARRHRRRRRPLRLQQPIDVAAPLRVRRHQLGVIVAIRARGGQPIRRETVRRARAGGGGGRGGARGGGGSGRGSATDGGGGGGVLLPGELGGAEGHHREAERLGAAATAARLAHGAGCGKGGEGGRHDEHEERDEDVGPVVGRRLRRQRRRRVGHAGAPRMHLAEGTADSVVGHLREAGREGREEGQQRRQPCDACVAGAHDGHLDAAGARRVHGQVGGGGHDREQLGERDRAERVTVERERRGEVERGVAQRELEVEIVPAAAEQQAEVHRRAHRRVATGAARVGEQPRVRRGGLEECHAEDGVEAAQPQAGELHAHLVGVGVRVRARVRVRLESCTPTWPTRASAQLAIGHAEQRAQLVDEVVEAEVAVAAEHVVEDVLDVRDQGRAAHVDDGRWRVPRRGALAPMQRGQSRRRPARHGLARQVADDPRQRELRGPRQRHVPRRAPRGRAVERQHVDRGARADGEQRGAQQLPGGAVEAQLAQLQTLEAHEVEREPPRGLQLDIPQRQAHAQRRRGARAARGLDGDEQVEAHVEAAQCEGRAEGGAVGGHGLEQLQRCQ
eukprot:scaffold65762_cov60-Phaeocystis_antarctica.AAC.3